MKSILFKELDKDLQNRMLDVLLKSGNEFFPKWVVSLIMPSHKSRFISADEVNAWMSENGIDGFASGSFLRCLFADDDGLAQYLLMWSSHGDL